MATDYLSEALGVSPPNPLLESISGSDATGNLWSQLNTWIEGLASTQRTKVVAAIQKWGAGQRTGGFGSTFGFGPGGLQLSQIQQLATTLQGSYGSTTAPVPGSTTAPTAKPLTAEQQKEAASNTVQSSATTAATTATAQLPESTVGNVAPGIPVVGSAGATIPGTSTPSDFNSLLQNYYQQEFATAGGDPTKLATAAGMTPQNLQAQYQAYTTGLQKAFANVPQGAGAYTPLSMEQFAQNKAQSMIGPWASVLSAISTIWQSQYQQTLPPELAAQIVSSLNSMPQSQQSNVLYNAYQYMTNSASAATNKSLFDQTGSYASAILSSLPSSILTYTSGSGTGTGALGTGGLVGTYAQLHPSTFLQGEAIQTQIAQDFQQALNRPPTAADLAALGAEPTPAAIKTYLDNQPMPGYPNMTYGAYTSVSGSITPQWEQYFGKDPTPAQLAYFVGKSPTDITSYFNNSMSSIPGITIGQKNDYETFIQSLDQQSPQVAGITHTFSSQVDNSMMDQLHQQVVAQSTAKPTPGKM